MKLPNVMFMKVELDRDGSEYLTAGKSIEEIAPDEFNKPQAVGIYKLVKKSRVVKLVRHVDAQ